MNDQYEINKIYKDEYGRPSGIFAVDKPIGLTSHDLVYQFRKAFETRNVGHAGALDPFASGLVIILVGKALKSADTFLNLDKQYQADILFGMSTESGDPEGKIIESVEEAIVNKDKLEKTLKKLQPQYKQYVPVFSSVKVDGQKLRILARDFDKFNTYLKEDGDKYIDFYRKAEVKKTLKLPYKIVHLDSLDILDESILEKNSLAQLFNEVRQISKEQFIKKDDPIISQNISINNFIANKYSLFKINIFCSKGTYIRQLAIDVGELMDPKMPSVLIGLRRISIGEYNINNVFDLRKDIILS